MKPTTKWITGALMLAAVIFACSPGPAHLIANPVFWEFREQFVFLTGVCALSLMVLSMIISVRHEMINRWMHGLDKAYVIHKWTGIFSTVLILMHFMGENVPHWLIEWNVIPNPGELVDGSQFSELEITLFQFGITLIQVFFYMILVLVAVALIKKIPYHIFRKTHKVFPFVFLIAAYHSGTAQLKEHWLDSPAGYMLLVLLSIGVFAALMGVFHKIGVSRTVKTTIEKMERHAHGILELQLKTDSKTFQHLPGQYAFIRFEHCKEPHPFTIASSGDDSNRLHFAIKSLGDFTSGLADTLSVGQTVQVEGPYGEFKFESKESERQVWIAGGIGITPFMARLKYLTKRNDKTRDIHFWYSTRTDLKAIFPENIEQLCQQAGVKLYHLNSLKKEYLTANKIHVAIGSFKNTSIWFCGPPAFAKSLQDDLAGYDFDKRLFHFDSFNMR